MSACRLCELGLVGICGRACIFARGSDAKAPQPVPEAPTLAWNTLRAPGSFHCSFPPVWKNIISESIQVETLNETALKRMHLQLGHILAFDVVAASRPSASSTGEMVRRSFVNSPLGS